MASQPPAGATPAAGKPLPPSLQHELEIQMGQDLSAVRVHENHAPTLMQAQAYTQGTDIHFAPGRYQPHDPAGRELLAHELTHVVQQRSGRCPAVTQP